MSRLSFNTLDVFTTTRLRGNQLGLVHVPANSPLTQSQKQAIAIEFNYSETVFLQQRLSSDPPKTYTAQIFTPASELPFAGHPTIGTAVWILENLESNDQITINLKAGAVGITYDRANGIATASIPHDVTVHQKVLGWERVAAVQPRLDGLDVTVPIVSITRGLNFALVDLSSKPELLAKVQVVKETVHQAGDLDEGSDPNLLATAYYCIEREDGKRVKIRQRMIWSGGEDPATGAASAALTCYLALMRGGKEEKWEFEIDQGVEMGRASKIFVGVTLDGTGKGVEKVELKGQAVEIMEGKIRYE